MTWYISDLARYRAEREGLEVLSQTIDWFIAKRWRIDNEVRMVLDADIVAGERIYPIYLQYPETFPHLPPSVFPRGDGKRWSHHQFGPGGELCLEYGPDTWTPDLTGVHMIESTHRLLEGENPGEGERGSVRSRHSDTLGQRMRSTYSRYLMTRTLEGFLPTLAVRTPATCNLVSAHHDESVTHVIDKITLADASEWIDTGIPPQLAAEYMERSFPICRLADDDSLPPTDSYGEFSAACAAFGMTIDKNHAFIVQGGTLHPYFLQKHKNSVRELAVIAAQAQEQRLDSAHVTLRTKRVALIGCGSLGSKVATMLARSGAEHFLLVDDDILLPDNFVRHDLDWRDAGSHKAVALARRLQFVNPSVEVIRWRARLAGQESNESADAVLGMIRDSDLVFDATANPQVLNLISAVCTAARKPIIWAEVFGGGIGGLIARCRPQHEPPPPYMRRAIENWFAERAEPPVRSSRSYATGLEGAPLIADDADVSAIAAHAARLAIDTLIERSPSRFPSSVYAIGLAEGSVFSQPFETYPIEVGPPLPSDPLPGLSAEHAAAEVAKIVTLFKQKADEAAAASDDS